MPVTIYALLVGIADYPRPTPALRGPLNDLAAMEQLLRGRAEAVGLAFEPLLLQGRAATRQAVIDAFRQHLARAGPADHIVFYFAGHGSRERDGRPVASGAPICFNETIVLYDSRKGGWDLADKELALLMAAAAAQGASVTVILDCCHAGSGTRAAAAVRRTVNDSRPRPPSSYLGPEQAPPPHVLLAACRADQEALEVLADGRWRGAFSLALETALASGTPLPTYRELMRDVRTRVVAKVRGQTPQIEASAGQLLDLRPFGGLAGRRHPYYLLSYNESTFAWMIDAGTLQGIAAPDDATSTVLAVYPSQLADDGAALPEPLADAYVRKVYAATSEVSLRPRPGRRLSPIETYTALVVNRPAPAMRVALSGTGAAAERLRHALATSGPGRTPSALVRLEESAGADVVVTTALGRYVIRRQGAPDDLLPTAAADTPADALRVAMQLEQVARWQALAALENPTSRISDHDIRFEVYLQSEAGAWAQADTTDLQLAYRLVGNAWQRPALKVRLTNEGVRPLYCVLADLTETYGIFTHFFPAGGTWLRPGEEAWAMEGEPIHARIPDELLAAGVERYSDLLKLIVCTAEFEANQLEQLDLLAARPPDLRQRSVGPPAPTHSLAMLLRRLLVRNTIREPLPPLVDWQTRHVLIIVTRKAAP